MVGVILFRAQPFHNGHLNMVQKAVSDCQKNNCDLYIFVGSADKAGTPRNPLPIDFRLMLIEGALHETFSTEELKHIHIFPLNDLTDEADNSYNWGRYLFMKMLNKTKDPDMTIYYSDRPEIMLSWFDAEDRWALRFKFLDRFDNISATEVRKVIMGEDTGRTLGQLLPLYVGLHLSEIRKYMYPFFNLVEGKYYYAISHRRENAPEDIMGNGVFDTFEEAKEAMLKQDTDDCDYNVYHYINGKMECVGC